MKITLFPPHAIIFVFDLTIKESIQIPKYIPGQVTAANQSCVSIGTQSYLDGAVTIKLSNRFPKKEKDEYKKVFDGAIDAPGGKIAVVTTDIKKILEIDIQNKKAHLSIWVDHKSNPGLILVEAI